MRLFLFFIFTITSYASFAQILVKGSLLDKSKINYVEGARVVSTGGQMAVTDSMGRYAISVSLTDSIFFVYNNKPTQKFAVSSVTNPEQFDIALQMPIKGKYTVLEEAVVYSKTYREDSVGNREDFKHVFEFKKPGIESSIVPGGGVGMDLDAFIHMFRFRRNKQMVMFRRLLEELEEDKYVSYRFSKAQVKRVTNLDGPALDSFLIAYRPTYFFTSTSSELDFNQYILSSYYEFMRKREE